ncbi:hypothetical protein MTO96_050060 [Rhipicephalus appendiculatus]
MECNDTLVWPVPFVLDVQGGIRVPEEGALWFRGTIQRYSLARDIGSSWLLVNVATVSYFRVQYDTDNVALLTSQLLKNHTVLNVNSRAKFLDDMVALTVRRMVSIDALAGLLTYLQVYVLFVAYLNLSPSSVNVREEKRKVHRSDWLPLQRNLQATIGLL